MTRTTEMVLALVVVTIIGSWSAVASKMVKDGANILWYYSAGMVSIGTWTWMAKRSPWPLMVSSIAWDIAYSLAFTGTTIVVLHEGGTKGQIAGVLIVAIGLFVMNL